MKTIENICVCLGLVLTMVSSNVLAAQTSKMILPFAGFGYFEDQEIKGSGAHLGVRMLLSSNENQRFGLEYSRINLITSDTNETLNFQAVGIVVEQTMWNWFLMSIGTIGYIEPRFRS